MTALGDLEDSSFGAAVAFGGGDLDLHAVTVHGGADLMGRDVDVALDLVAHSLAFWRDKTVAIAMHGEVPGDQVFACRRGGQRVAVTIDLD